MVYTEHDNLTIITLEQEIDSISFNEIITVLQKRPASVIYCELNRKLYGVISYGDVRRAKAAGKRAVNINRIFTSAGPNEYMKIRQIFRDREKINAVPVVDENGRLLGDYVRWDDLLALEHMNLFVDNQYAVDFWKNNNYIVLVNPCESFPKRKLLFEKWKFRLENTGIRIEIIDRMSIPEYFDKVQMILFTDEDEKRGAWMLMHLLFNGMNIGGKSSTYKELELGIKAEMADDILNAIKRDVYILALQWRNNDSEYCQRLVNEELPQKFVRAEVPITNKLPLSAMYDFFEGLYTEEDAKTVAYSPFRIECSGFSNKIKDITGKYHNVKDGERLTIGQPEEYDRTVYFFGCCTILGAYVEDKHTIESFLQAKCNNMGIRCKVVNMGCWDSRGGVLNRIMQTPIKKDDIIVVDLMKEIQGVDSLDLTRTLENNNVPGKWFVNIFRHCNYKVNQIYADAIYEKLEPMLQTPADSFNQLINADKDIVVETYIEHYFKYYFTDFCVEQYGTIGSIVMNCNPFTNGHRYLIEEALKVVDFLIVFVVEEDKSFFTFDERFALVSAGVEDLQNVMVVPSGQFILSQRTFPEYFVKVEDEDLVQNLEFDITLFAEQIAPRLNITYRFVGEEPQDRVTNEYNRIMKRVLPGRGINVVEIPRKENGNGIISASLVRKYLEENNFTELEGLIPKSTRDILLVRNSL